MAWTAPYTPAPNDMMTAAIWAPQVRDNLNELRGGGLAIGGQAAGRIPYASSATQLATSAAFTFDGTASLTLGPGGTGATVANQFVDGGSASGGGSYTMYRRNSVNKGAVGTHSAIIGGTSDNFVVYSTSAIEFSSGGASVIRGRINSGGGLDLGSGTTVNDAWVGFYRDTATTSMWQMGVRQDVGGSNDDFKLLRFNTSAVFQDIPLQIATASGDVQLTGKVKSSGQPGFLAFNSVADAGVTSGTNVDFDTEVYDELGNFVTDTFTAPVTGRYLFQATVQVPSGSGSSTREIYLVTNNRTYLLGASTATAAASTLSGSVIADMDAGHTASVQIVMSGTVSVNGDNTTLYTHFSGRLLL